MSSQLLGEASPDVLGRAGFCRAGVGSPLKGKFPNKHLDFEKPKKLCTLNSASVPVSTGQTHEVSHGVAILAGDWEPGYHADVVI